MSPLSCKSAVMKLAGLVFAVLCVAAMPALAAETRQWSYKTHDSEFLSPAQWSLKYLTCAGKRQSPVDIQCGSRTTDTPAPLRFSGDCGAFAVEQTSEAYKLEVQSGTCAVEANAVTYALAQFHVHAPSEHHVDGKALDGELHFVHTNGAGEIAVVGVFLEHTVLGATDPFVAAVLDGLKYTNATTAAALTLPSYAALVTTHLARGRVFNYPGSLTTPGCDEVVDWWVVESPLAISSLDLVRLYVYLHRIKITALGRNARPTQPLNGRVVAIY